MRLTLRTLLAWLDDTLSPSEVREIGHQVAESQFARDLVARIQKVTRQRRLTIPHGDEAVDPNIVAAYLDNELSAEEVTNFEKVCLTSNVHLAEAASVHQILSLIGQKAKVPDGARERMYRRVKGRETRAVATHAPIARPAPRTPVTPPIAAWSAPVPLRRSLAERFGPVLAVFGLLGVLVWSAWMSVGQSESVQPAPRVADKVLNKIEKKKVDPEPKAEQPAAVIAAKSAEPAAPESKVGVEPKGPAVAPGTFGLVGTSDAVLLRFVEPSKDWERIATDANLRPGDKLISLTPGRTELGLAKTNVSVVGQSEVRLKAADAGQAAHLILEQGRIVVKTPAMSDAVAVEVGEQMFTISSERPIAVGIGRELARMFPATPLSTAVVTLVAVPDGELSLTLGSKTEKIIGPKVVLISSDSTTIESSEYPIPAWIHDAALPVIEAGPAKAFGQYLSNKRPVKTSLAEAIDDELAPVRRMAIKALGLLGDLSLIVPILSQTGSSSSRQAAIEVLRDYRARGTDEADAIWEQIRKSYGDIAGRKVEKLLVGYTPVEAQDESNLAKLVSLLADPDIAVRELAIDNLKVMTRRDAMEYDPEKPDGSGIRAWQDALKTKTLAQPKPAKP